MDTKFTNGHLKITISKIWNQCPENYNNKDSNIGSKTR